VPILLQKSVAVSS